LIAAEKTNYPVAVMCRVLEVNRTAFHNWERRAPSDRALSDAWLTEKIKRIHVPSRGVYGAPRIHAELRMEHDVRVGRKRVARLMKAAGISGVRPRKRWRTTIRILGITPATDLVNRDFKPSTPNVLWVAEHHLPAHRRGLAVSRRRAGRVLPPDRRLGDGDAHALQPGGRRAEDGARTPAAAAGVDPPLRPGLARRIQPAVATLDREELRWAGQEGGPRSGRGGR
jgi:transposase InsO family protein